MRSPTTQAEIGLLIGVNIPKAMALLQVINSVDYGPYAVRTVFGWIINGLLRGGYAVRDTNKMAEVTANRISVARLEDLWQLQFKQDFPDAGLDSDIEMSKDDHQFIQMVTESSEMGFPVWQLTRWQLERKSPPTTEI